MTPRKKKLSLILVLLLGIGGVVGLVLYALKQNIDLYYTPTQIDENPPSTNRHFRVGGMVVKGSVHYGEITSFELTDMHQNITVHYRGILPDLFREGQGIVANGHINAQKTFIADEVLAKHDENYMPPQIDSKN
jgi:cytochrome c-type biogenesis protein CcmE